MEGGSGGRDRDYHFINYLQAVIQVICFGWERIIFLIVLLLLPKRVAITKR